MKPREQSVVERAPAPVPAPVPSRVKVTYEPTPRVASERYRAAVELVVSTSLPGRWRADWQPEQDQVTFSPRPVLPNQLLYPVDLKPETGLVTYGRDENMSLQKWHLDRQPHLLVIGPTGGGKTSAIRSIILPALLLPEGAEVFGADPKLIELAGLVGYPGVRRVATEPEECVDVFNDVIDEMWRRYALVREDPRAKKTLARLFLVLDEFFIMRLRLNRLWRETKPKDAKGSTHPVIESMPELAALARSARIHLILGIQRPDAEFLEGSARDNFRHRMSLTTLSGDGARMMWGDGSTAGTDLPTIPGRAMATNAVGRPTEVQVFWTPDPDPRLVDDLSPEEVAVLRALRPSHVVEGTEIPQRRTEAEEAVKRGLAAGAVLLERPSVTLATRHEKDTTGTASPEPAAAEIMVEGEEVSAWARAEELTIGDQVEFDGQWVDITEVMDDEGDDEEDLVYLEWGSGSTTLPADELVRRMVGALTADETA